MTLLSPKAEIRITSDNETLQSKLQFLIKLTIKLKILVFYEF